MSFNMPVNRIIKHYDHQRNAEQRTTSATNAFNRCDTSVTKMYPDKFDLPQSVLCAIKYQDGNTYQ